MFININPIMADATASDEVPGHGRRCKRICQPQNWRQNIAKRKRNSGQAYVNKVGRLVPAKKIGPVCTDG